MGGPARAQPEFSDSGLNFQPKLEKNPTMTIKITVLLFLNQAKPTGNQYKASISFSNALVLQIWALFPSRTRQRCPSLTPIARPPPLPPLVLLVEVVSRAPVEFISSVLASSTSYAPSSAPIDRLFVSPTPVDLLPAWIDAR